MDITSVAKVHLCYNSLVTTKNQNGKYYRFINMNKIAIYRDNSGVKYTHEEQPQLDYV